MSDQEVFACPSGWVYNEERIAAANERMESAGYTVAFDADRPQLKGCWSRKRGVGITRVMAQDAEKKVTGSNRKTNVQRRGTCVGQGHSRGIEDTHYGRLAAKAIIGKAVQIVYEAMYGGERAAKWGKTHPWGCGCGNCPDGLSGADAAAWYTLKGALARGMYGDFDLTAAQEHFAIDWNNSGVPEILVAASVFHKLRAHSSNSWDDYADAVSSEHYGAICLPKLFYGRVKDKNGCVEPDGDGGHCTECSGVLVLPSGETGFVIQNSWPVGATKYPSEVQTASGPVPMREGQYVVRQSVLEGISSRYRDRVERHSYEIPPEASFR